jgi:murein DD-endopeptidase MepM/ murein hydrolase activator NlpD/GH24 family phage-related lysozyme (muramidase)
LDFTQWKQELFEEYIQKKSEIDKNLKIKIIQNKVKLIQQKTQLLTKYDCKYIELDSINTSQEDIFVDEESFSWQTNEDNCITLNRILSSEAQLKPLWSERNPLLWPVNAIRWISSYFQDPSYDEEVGSSHDAIDIRLPQGTDIKAPADGYITYVKEPIDEWYAYVVLKHTSWLITIYWHVSEVLFKQYDVVKAGEVFARSGGEFWVNWSWIMTTWPHLHFEVRKDKTVVDPFDYLDLTKMPYERIPNIEKYIEKFASDYFDKYGYSYWGDLNIIDLLRWFEWFRENAYLDIAWVWTVWYWFTYLNWLPVKEWDTITLENAEIELIKRANYYTNFKNFITVPLTREQEIALSSFEYNLWRNIWTKTDEDWWAMPIIDMINIWDIIWAAEYLKEFNSAWNKISHWLTNRRNKEANLLLSGFHLDTVDLDEIYKVTEENQ